MIMRYLRFLIQYIINIFNSNVSLFSRIENSKIAKSTKIYRGVTLNYSDVGDYTYVGPHAKIVHTEIGKFCSIAEKSFIGLPAHPLSFISSSPIFISANNALGIKWINESIKFDEYKDVKIGNDVWIGAGAMIVGGVMIGDGAVIGAGAVVTKNVPPYAIVGGIPAKIIRYRFEKNVIENLLKSEWWNLPQENLKSRIEMFQTETFASSLNDLAIPKY